MKCFVIILLPVTSCASPSAPLDAAPPIDAGDAMGDVADTSTAIACATPPPFGPGGGACTFTYDQCSDGRVYQVNCAGGMPPAPCDCRIQDEAGLTPGKQIAQDVCNLPSSQWLQTINQGCGWNIVSR